MKRFRILPALLAVVAFALICAPSSSQQAQPDQNPSTPKPKLVRQPAQHPMLFAPGSERLNPAAPVEFRPYDQMTPQDHDLAASANSVIAERAAIASLDFSQDNWSSQQLLCSALPNHLFLLFTRGNSAGDVSLFSVSIPRGASGQVRVIPIQRRGYSLFSPAPVNAQTISAFNHIRDEERPAQAPEWLATGLCYAALAGAHPQIGPPEETSIQKLPAAPTGSLAIPPSGGAVISFTDVSAIPRPMQWTMTFDSRGKLLKARHSAAPKSKEKVRHRTPVEAQGKLVPQRH